MRTPKIVYIAHPIKGAVKNNISRIEKIIESIMQRRGAFWPIAPYLDACRYLDDADESDRSRAFSVNKKIFECGVIDELWVCGALSNGVREEIDWATRNEIDIKFFDYETLVEE